MMMIIIIIIIIIFKINYPCNDFIAVSELKKIQYVLHLKVW